jgi:hypothetical protein
MWQLGTHFFPKEKKNLKILKKKKKASYVSLAPPLFLKTMMQKFATPPLP